MSNHSVSYALNEMVLKIIDGYLDDEISENYVRQLFSQALATSRQYDGNDYEVLEDVSNKFCGKCLKLKEGDFYKSECYSYTKGNSMVKIPNSFFDREKMKYFKDIAEKFNFSEDDISFLEGEFNKSCTNALCTDCLKKALDEITGDGKKTDEVLEYVTSDNKS